ncbi:hypothetical protein KP509_39G050100 [Ceratopteris richardii]|uniref:Uncharacterized protein n=1 Tax=Ceratopteris richardii TaxID=49495 RepID=A0A8T2Q1V3_CERRI|nr:hypothetical protein KP509_39G050100 [Ceratopteris richardii]
MSSCLSSPAQVLYSPHSAGSFSSGQIIITSSSQYGASLTCTGYALQPSVSISASVDFGSSPLGSSISSSLLLCNMSKIHACFQFIPTSATIFGVHPEKGVIRPQSNRRIYIRFKPQEARNYYRRVFCIVQDQHLLFCDLIGSCYLDKVNFPTLQLPNITQKWNLSSDSLCGFQSSSTGIEEISFSQTSSDTFIYPCENSLGIHIDVYEDSFVGDEKKKASLQCFTKDVSEKVCMVKKLWEEYFLGRSQCLDFVEITPEVLNFGDIPYLQVSEKQDVVVRNVSDLTISCTWQISNASDEYSSSVETLPSQGPWIKEKIIDGFQVSPREATILPQSYMTFYITFMPKKRNQFYVEALNLCIFQMCKHVTIPYQASVQVTGSSFDSDQHKFLPQAYFFPSSIALPSALLGSRVYQTVALRNQSCTPLRFAFDTSNLSRSFSVKPLQGIIEEKGFQLISFCFQAGDPSSHIVKLPCILNDNSNEKIMLTIIARSDVLKVELEEGDLIHFEPTNVGVCAGKTITLWNRSSIPAVFKWNVPREVSDIFTFKPFGGVIFGNQRVKIDCSFCPTLPLGFRADIFCLTAAINEKIPYNGEHGSAFVLSESCKVTATFRGEGRNGSVKIEPQQVDLGTVIVGFPQQCKVTITNTTDAPVTYALNYKSLNETRNEDYKLKLDKSQGSIPSLSSTEVYVTFKPNIVSCFSVCILCNIDPYMDFEGSTERMPQCLLSARALFPSLSICGVRGERFSQAQAWHKLQLDAFELLLAQSEIKQDVGLNGCLDLFGLGGSFHEHWSSAFDFRFGRGHLSSKPTVFILVFECRNDLPVSWKIRLWNDKDVDLENWVDKPEPNDEKEQMYMNVRNQGLIQVFPSQGLLNPKERIQIKFIYRHYVEGTHVFPAILQIKNGSALPIMFCGETLPRELNFLSVESETFHLSPIEVGHANPPLQTFELRNDGNSELHYEVELGHLRDLQEENFGFKVLECLNPVGSIPAFETLLLNWKFQPIEAKCYATDVFISVHHGEGVILHIEGNGIKKTEPESRPEFLEGKIDCLHPLLTSCKWVGLPAMLTLEQLNYGNVLALSSVERIIAVKNVSEDSKISFTWQSSYAADNSVYGQFSIMPINGVIECGGSCICKITFTAGIHPQCFETTLYCHIKEVNPENVSLEDHQLHSAGGDEYGDEIFAQEWERLGSPTSIVKEVDYRTHVISNLTYSTNLRLPRLSAKGPLRFSSAILKPLTDDEQGTRSEHTKKSEGVLYLTVIGSIYSTETSTMPSIVFDQTQGLKGCIDVRMQLLVKMLGEALQEVAGVQVAKSRVQRMIPSYFEQFGDCGHLINVKDYLRQSNNKNAPVVSSSESILTTRSCPQVEMSVRVFDLTKSMLEHLLFEAVKELHDCETMAMLRGSS